MPVTLDTGLDRLATAAAGLAGLGPAELVAALAETTLGDAGPADDVALLVVRAVPAPLQGRLPARGESVRVLRRLGADWERAAGLPDELAEDLELALGEAAANAAEHAYPPAAEGEFDYTVARRADGDIEVAVRDHGRWRPVPADNGHRGHGLRVIAAIAADLQIDRGADGTRVRFRRATLSSDRSGRAGRSSGELPAHADADRRAPGDANGSLNRSRTPRSVHRNAALP